RPAFTPWLGTPGALPPCPDAPAASPPRSRHPASRPPPRRGDRASLAVSLPLSPLVFVPTTGNAVFKFDATACTRKQTRHPFGGGALRTGEPANRLPLRCPRRQTV